MTYQSQHRLYDEHRKKKRLRHDDRQTHQPPALSGHSTDSDNEQIINSNENKSLKNILQIKSYTDIKLNQFNTTRKLSYLYDK